MLIFNFHTFFLSPNLLIKSNIYSDCFRDGINRQILGTKESKREGKKQETGGASCVLNLALFIVPAFREAP